MGLFSSSTDYAKVAGQKLCIAFPTLPDGSRRNPDKGHDSLYIVTVHDDRTQKDRIFQFHEPSAGEVDREVQTAIEKSRAHGIPVIMDVMRKAVIVDGFDRVDQVMESYRGIQERDMQGGLDAYKSRLETRSRMLQAAASMSDIELTPGEHADGLSRQPPGSGRART